MSTEKATCRECGQEFEHESSHIALPRKFTPNLCEKCGADMDAAFLAEYIDAHQVERNVEYPDTGGE